MDVNGCNVMKALSLAKLSALVDDIDAQPEDGVGPAEMAFREALVCEIQRRQSLAIQRVRERRRSYLGLAYTLRRRQA